MNVMTKAWEISRNAVAKFGGKASDYFRSALKMAWGIIRGVTMSTEQKLLDLGLESWKGKRIYIKDDFFEVVFGLKLDRYKSGQIKKAYLNGEEISNNQAWKLSQREYIYFDIEKNVFVGTEMKPII
ncbi:hypothetical protein [Thorsellia anophelis]|uniref:Bacteriophage Gp111 protein n=1 Tax=Thorsellia anophelis DSM 18579 TaxID=1123402 RepID=A0A1I0D6P4_9GAMM|nr:hypothetical protein [Thorsellia anophelis]SET27533.1 bacteriophage Gp111 protein [Thorsellia anophelis DSM 18579]